MENNQNPQPNEGYQPAPAYQPPQEANPAPAQPANPAPPPAPPSGGYSSQTNPYATPQQPTNPYAAQPGQQPGQAPQYSAQPAGATDSTNDKLYAILSYIGPLFLVGMLAAPNSKFVKYHNNQGLVLFLAEVIWGVASTVLGSIFTLIGLGLLGTLLGLVSIVFFVLMIMGIINANAMKEEPLPVIGGFTVLK